jgi:N-formylglutamate amidohydrolase
MPGTVAGDLVLGTRSGDACGPALCELAIRALGGQCTPQRGLFGSRWPLSLSIDDPYQGGHIAGSFGRPHAHVHALQLEVSRALYMDEYRLDPRPLPDPGELDRLQTEAAPWSQTAQPLTRDRRKLLALVSAIDTLVLELSRERLELADRTAAE